MNQKQFKEAVRQIVKEELEEILPKLMEEVIPQLVKENVARAFGNLILEAADTPAPTPTRSREPEISNSRKRELLEGIRKEIDGEFATMGNRTFTSADMGAIVNRNIGSSPKVSIDHAMTEAGTPIPIDPNSIPKPVRDALNKDYRGLMAALNKGKK